MSYIQKIAYQICKSNSRRLLEWAKTSRDQGNRADAAMFLQAASQMRREAMQLCNCANGSGGTPDKSPTHKFSGTSCNEVHRKETLRRTERRC